MVAVMMAEKAVVRLAEMGVMEVRAVVLEIEAVSGPCGRAWVLSEAQRSVVRKAVWASPRCTSW
jgi:hypothetical protein